MDTSGEPIACTLTTKDARAQLLEWTDLQGQASAVQAIDKGVRITLPAAIAAQVQDLTERESTCCAFLNIDTNVDGTELTLEIRSDNPDALPVISALAGIPLPEDR